jgi:hypothetical protein
MAIADLFGVLLNRESWGQHGLFRNLFNIRRGAPKSRSSLFVED